MKESPRESPIFDEPRGVSAAAQRAPHSLLSLPIRPITSQRVLDPGERELRHGPKAAHLASITTLTLENSHNSKLMDTPKGVKFLFSYFPNDRSFRTISFNHWRRSIFNSM